jgi:hypothetical protein
MRHDALHPPFWKRGTILDSTGDMIADAAQCDHCFQVIDAKDCSHVFGAFKIRDIRQSCYVNGELAYEECECFPTPTHSAFNLNTYSGSSLYYCDLCMNNCQDCFGCVGLKHARYCILNKQYGKEEYETLIPKIIDRMSSDGEWGEFLPIASSVVHYNESQACDLFTLSEAEARKRGWSWRAVSDDLPSVSRTIAATDLPDMLDDTPDDILSWAILCRETKRPFRIIKQELEFYRRQRLPIPRIHLDVRHRNRTALCNSRHVWERSCGKCGEKFATSYAPKQTETVYCEECYLATVY